MVLKIFNSFSAKIMDLKSTKKKLDFLNLSYEQDLEKLPKSYAVELHVVIIKIGQIDTKNETFYAEFFLEATWIEEKRKFDSNNFYYDPKKHFNPDIYINNSIGEPLQDITYYLRASFENNPSKYVLVSERRKIRGYFWQKFDFKYFPMDVQSLNLEISSTCPSNRVTLVGSKEKFNFFNPNAFVDVQEWKLHDLIRSKVNLNENEISTDRHSFYTISIIASRIPTYYFYNVYFLVFLITNIGLAKFSIKCDKPQTRLNIDTSITLNLIMLRLAITNQLPQISYLTSLDKYLLFSIIFISSQCVYDGVISKLTISKCETPYATYDFIAFLISASLIAVANLIFLIWIIYYAFRIKKDINKQCKLYNKSNSEKMFQIYNRNIQAFNSSNNANNFQSSLINQADNFLTEIKL